MRVPFSGLATMLPRLAGPVCSVALVVLAMLAGLTTPAPAQQLDLSHGGPIDITARDGIEWRQVEQEVIARGDAKAIRGNVTVLADRLTAWYRKKGATQGTQPAGASGPTGASGPAGASGPTGASGLAGDISTEGNEVYRLQADGHVRILTETDHAEGDKATYDLDQSVLVMTGRDLKLTTPNNVITAKDDLEYWPQKHMAVARGNAVVVTTDAKRIAADTLVAYTTDNPPPNVAKPEAASAKPSQDPLASSGK
ncbi:MAG TPA: LptA/OstA family protein, partial [Rhodopila sp.]